MLFTSMLQNLQSGKNDSNINSSKAFFSLSYVHIIRGFKTLPFDHTSYQENKIKFIQILVYISNTYRNDVKTLFSFF